MIKYPPIAKIYEAYTCIADNRVEFYENEAIVTSSDGKKKYIVKWKDNIFASNDNATFWQGYPGYPVIAVLMIQNKLSYDEEIIKFFKNINWHELNNKYKRDYDKAVEEVLNNIDFDKGKIKGETNRIYEELKQMNINIQKKLV